MNKNQFDVLYALVKNKITSQRELSAITDLSLGTINSILAFLKDKKYIDAFQVTALGQKTLDNYKVDNAVIMAAGMSSRFAPISYELPKGLLEVRGEKLIERQIKQLRESGIDEIIVVLGYMKEKFFYLEDKYGVKLLINEEYHIRNNNSTLFVARDYIKNSYICSSDNYFSENIFEPYVYDSFYSSVYNAGETDEYCMRTNLKGRITKVTVGGENEWIMLGHVYFSKAFSTKFLGFLVDEYNEVGVDKMLWEDLYVKHIKDLDMEIKKYETTQIYEFDSLDDLRLFDPKYVNNTGSKILGNICQVLKCEEQDIKDIEPIKKGLTNISFLFSHQGKKYVYRHPGAGTEEIINRVSEATSQNLAKKLGLDNTLIFISAEEGWKISHYIDNCMDFDYHNEEQVIKGLALVKKLHDAEISSEWDFNIFNEAEKLVTLTNNKSNNSFDDFEELRKTITDLYTNVENDGIKKRICHNDCYSPNFLTNGDVMYLIDWEYSGNSDPASDLGTFLCCSDYTTEEALNVLEIYFGRPLIEMEKRHYLAYVGISGYYWFVWALYKESVGEIIGEYTYIWYKYAKTYGNMAMKMYQ